MKTSLPIVALVPLALLAGCARLEPIRTESSVDLERFMGDWYVIANIPTFLEKDAYQAVESYKRLDDGTIDTTFTFRKGGFDGPEKTYQPRGFVRDTQSNAEWGMRFVWPFKAEYRIVYLDDAYSQTVIGRRKRDYLWIMARTPTIPEDDLEALIQLVHKEGYDTNLVQRVPQVEE